MCYFQCMAIVKKLSFNYFVSRATSGDGLCSGIILSSVWEIMSVGRNEKGAAAFKASTLSPILSL